MTPRQVSTTYPIRGSSQRFTLFVLPSRVVEVRIDGVTVGTLVHTLRGEDGYIGRIAGYAPVCGRTRVVAAERVARLAVGS